MLLRHLTKLFEQPVLVWSADCIVLDYLLKGLERILSDVDKGFVCQNQIVTEVA